MKFWSADLFYLFIIFFYCVSGHYINQNVTPEEFPLPLTFSMDTF